MVNEFEYEEFEEGDFTPSEDEKEGLEEVYPYNWDIPEGEERYESRQTEDGRRLYVKMTRWGEELVEEEPLHPELSLYDYEDEERTTSDGVRVMVRMYRNREEILREIPEEPGEEGDIPTVYEDDLAWIRTTESGRRLLIKRTPWGEELIDELPPEEGILHPELAIDQDRIEERDIGYGKKGKYRITRFSEEFIEEIPSEEAPVEWPRVVVDGKILEERVTWDGRRILVETWADGSEVEVVEPEFKEVLHPELEEGEEVEEIRTNDQGINYNVRMWRTGEEIVDSLPWYEEPIHPDIPEGEARIVLRENYAGEPILVKEWNMGEEIVANVPKTIADIYRKYEGRIIKIMQGEASIKTLFRDVPGIINTIDDAQDILITAMLLGKPILRALGKRIAPGVGWLLAASDIMNLATMTLAQTQAPGLAKPAAMRSSKQIKTNIKDPGTAFQNFTGKTNWRGKMSGVIQGAQAADTLTGKGLQLGALVSSVNTLYNSVLDIGIGYLKGMFTGNMIGFVNEGIVSLQEAQKGLSGVYGAAKKTAINFFEDIDSVLVKLQELGMYEEPEEDNYETGLYGFTRSPYQVKASRFLLQTPTFPNIWHDLSMEDQRMLLAATNVAVGMLTEQTVPVNDSLINRTSLLPAPNPIPTKRIIYEALKNKHIPMGDMNVPRLDMTGGFPTIGDAVDEAMSKTPEWMKTLDSNFKDPAERAFWAEMHREASSDIIHTLTGKRGDEYTALHPLIISAGQVAEWNFRLTPPYSNSDLENLHMMAWRYTDLEGKKTPGEREWIQAATYLGLKWIKKYN